MQWIHNQVKPLLLNKASIPTLTKDKINAVYFYHSFINANLYLCYAGFSYSLMQREWHFHFKKWDIKTRWLCLRMAGIAFPRTWIFQNFPGENAPGPPTGGPQKAALFHQTPSTKNLHSSHSLSFLYWCPIFQLCLRRTVWVGPEPSTCPS